MMKRILKVVFMLSASCLFLFFGVATAKYVNHALEPLRSKRFAEVEKLLKNNKSFSAENTIQDELKKIAEGVGGIKENYKKAKEEREKTSKRYIYGPAEEEGFANAQAKLIVAAAKIGRTKEAESVFRAAKRGGVLNENVYFARDLAKTMIISLEL